MKSSKQKRIDAMQESETLLDTLHDYLKGQEWQQSIEMFVKANCKVFKQYPKEFTHKHNDLWKGYQEIVETILDVALSNVGGSIDALEGALDILASTPAIGPRDAVMKDIVGKLLTYNDFDSFVKMMHNVANDDNYNDDDNNNDAKYSTSHHQPSHQSNHHNDLINLGFDEDLVSMILYDESSKDASLEDLVMKLSEMQAQPKQKTFKRLGNEANENKITETKASPNHISSSSSPTNRNTTFVPSQKTRASHRMPHLQKFAEELDDDFEELVSKFVMARSVIDEFNTGDIAPNVVVLLQWASDMMSLESDIEIAFNEKIPFNEMTSEHRGGLITWFKALEDTRHQIDSEEIAGKLLSDNEFKRMADLNRIASMGTEDEQFLHSVISRHEEVQKEVNLLHQRCDQLVTSDRGIKRECLEELYLYLKEKVGSGVDFTTIADEMHEQVYSMVSSSKGTDIVNLLLDMHVLDEEKIYLYQQIQSLLSPSKQADSKEAFDGFDNNEVNAGQQFQFDEYGNLIEVPDAKTPLGRVREDKNNSSDRKNSNAKGDDNDKDTTANSLYLEELKATHKVALTSLQNAIDNEKQKKLKELEDRLRRRKALRRKEGVDASDAELEEDAELENEINATIDRFEGLKDCLSSGLKKKCLHEMKLAKKIKRPLTEEDQEDCMRKAADALKERYERDQKSLMENLEDERLRQRKKIFEQLQERKKRANKDEEEAIEKKAIEDLASLEKVFNDNKVAALAQPQSDAFLSLATIYMDPSTLKLISNSTKGDDDDDDYLDDNDNNKVVKQWLDNVEKLKNSYIASNTVLQNNVRKVECEKLGLLDVNSLEDNVKESDSGFIDLSCHMNNIMIEAFTKQLKDIYRTKTSSSPSISLDSKYLMDEFDKSKSQYNSLLKTAEERAKAKLEERKRRSGGKSKGIVDDSKDNDDDLGISSIVSTFLRNPVSSGVSSPVQVVSTTKANNNTGSGKKLPPLNRLPSIKGKGGFGTSDDDEIDRTRIVTMYEEKEKKLVDGLQVQMQKKKQILEERLQKKKEQRSKQLSESGSHPFHSDDIAEDEREIAKLQEAFQNVVNLVKNADNRQLNNVDINTLVGAMDKIANGEFLPTLSAAATAVHYQENDSSRTATHSTTLSEFGEKQLMQDEVKNICAVYSEEKQKHDLIMKLQQTRQRQNLQRKLLERKKDNASAEPVKGLGAFGSLNKNDIFGDAKDDNKNKDMQSRGLHLTPIKRQLTGGIPMEQLL